MSSKSIHTVLSYTFPNLVNFWRPGVGVESKNIIFTTKLVGIMTQLLYQLCNTQHHHWCEYFN